MRHTRSLLGGTALALAIFAATRMAGAASVPAITAFDQAFSKVNDYTVTIKAREVLGTQVQNRTYHYWFKRPDLAKTLIVAGDGAGSGGVWNGGDQVSGHQGGFLSFIHLKVGLHDPRATSLRGYTIPHGLLQNEVNRYAKIKGTLTQKVGPPIGGIPTDEVDLTLANPSKHQGVTRMIIYLDQSTHFPLRQLRYAGGQIVADETFLDLKTNVGLKASDFPF